MRKLAKVDDYLEISKIGDQSMFNRDESSSLKVTNHRTP